MEGQVVAVSRSPTHTLSKQNQPSIRLLAGLRRCPAGSAESPAPALVAAASASAVGDGLDQLAGTSFRPRLNKVCLAENPDQLIPVDHRQPPYLMLGLVCIA